MLSWFFTQGKSPQKHCVLSGPVLRDTARLSQRYSPIARYGFLVSQHGQLRYPLPLFLSDSPFESMRSGGAIPPPPQKGYLSDTCAFPFENKANWYDTPLCHTISKGYCAIWGVSRTGPLRNLRPEKGCDFENAQTLRFLSRAPNNRKDALAILCS